MRSVPFEFVSGLAAEFGAVECCWRESERSFTGYVAECWFAQLPSAFAYQVGGGSWLPGAGALCVSWACAVCGVGAGGGA